MIIKATHSFIKQFKKDFASYHFDIDDLVVKLQETPMISLKYPIVKAKFYIKGISVRGFCLASKNTIIPLYFVIKNSKHGSNLILDKNMSQMLDTLIYGYNKELESGRYNIYN